MLRRVSNQEFVFEVERFIMAMFFNDVEDIQVYEDCVLDFKDGEKTYRVNAASIVRSIDQLLDSISCTKLHIWNLFQIDRAGHLAVDPILFCSIFNIQPKDLVVLIPKGRPMANRAYLDAFCYGAQFVEVDNIRLMYILHVGRHVLRHGSRTYYCIGRLVGEIYRQRLPFNGGLRINRPNLPDSFEADVLFKKYGLEVGQYVVVHNREPGFFPAFHHGHRDSSIETLIPAIRSFQLRGLKVVRIGDKSMQRLPEELGVIETQIHNEREERDDVLLIRYAWLYFGTSSGPLGLAEILGTRILGHNYTSFATCNSNDCEFLMKKYIDGRTGRFLSYFELFTNWIGYSQSYRDLINGDIHVISNTPNEISRSVDMYLEDHLGKTNNLNNYTELNNLNKAINNYNINRGLRGMIYDPAYSPKTIPSRFYMEGASRYFLSSF
jgi:putative glycosyltransferase (TIGR04372 family)